jgi:hypothetical protein
MNRRKVGEDMGSKEKDRCPLTLVVFADTDIIVPPADI